MEFTNCKLIDILADMHSGGTPSTTEPTYWNGDIKWLSSGETGQRFINDTIDNITTEGVKKSSTKLAKKHNVVMACAGQGKTRGQTSYLLDDMYINQSIIALEPKSCVLPLYLFYDLTSRYEELRGGSDASSTRGSITTTSLKKLNFRYPCLDKQKKITNILYSYDELIENNNKRIKVLEQMAENLYKEWFVRFRFPGHETTEFENGLPKGWQTKRLGEFGVFLDSGSRPKGGIDDTLIEGVPSLGAEAVGELAQFDYSSVKYIPHEFYDKMKRGKFDGNAILVYKDGAYIGKTTIFRNKFPFENFAANEHVFLMKSTNFAYQNYLYFTLHQKEYFYLMQNLNRNAAQPGLAQPDIKRIKITVPTENVAKRFNVVIEPLFDEIFQIAKTNRNLIKQRDMLLPRLMSGKLEVCEKKEKVLEFKPKKTFVEFKNEFKAAARKDGGLTEQDLQELYKAYCDDSLDE